MTDSTARAPKRIQRKRTKGWKMPDNAVNVTRPGEFGNPFRIGGYFRIGPKPWLYMEGPMSDTRFTLIKDAAMAVEWYRKYRTEINPLSAEEKAKLHGKDLACWCPLDQPCHADALLEIANGK